MLSSEVYYYYPNLHNFYDALLVYSTNLYRWKLSTIIFTKIIVVQYLVQTEI